MRNTPVQRAKARKAILDWRRNVRPLLPKCGAKRRRDGEPCQQIAMENGRCHRHGGLTGSGSDWHKTKFTGIKSEAKLNRKLRDQAKAEKKRRARLDAMTDEQRAKYEAWQRAHRPGAPTRRAQARKERSDASTLRFASPAPIDPEIQVIQCEIDRLEATLRKCADDDLGIFG
ncbi:HGGxSTG domain-containing protein [Oryzifoliimicrobium ureilyticus]|uniref:HGGxSTG domain-containing protein n=1 Tax=Oryzifoliimicrobium ureilyticus TaxID=3113724 RepID=UPI003075F4EC